LQVRNLRITGATDINARPQERLVSDRLTGLAASAHGVTSTTGTSLSGARSAVSITQSDCPASLLAVPLASF
jgi:hypothetical protein